MNLTKSVIELVNNINKNLINHNITKKQKILITISGGQDSICLFFLFIHLKKQWKWSFGIIYCNHLWQKNSFYSGSLVIKIAYLFLIPIYYSISPNKIFKEKSSRYWRYDCFYRLSFFYQYELINLGHTLNDKIETSFFQSIRGSSLKSILCLKNVKYFYSKNKFTKNTNIKTTRIYNRFIVNQIDIKNTNYKNYNFAYSLCNKSFGWKNRRFFLPLRAFFSMRNNNYVFSSKLICFKKRFYKNYLNVQENYYPIFSKASKIGKALKKNRRFFKPRFCQQLVYIKSNQTVFQFILQLMQTNEKKKLNPLKSCKKIFDFSTQKSSFPKLFSSLPLLFRPILRFNRCDMKKILLFFQLPLFPDISNQKRIFYRNRIRKDLLPTLKFFFNKQVEKSFFQFEEIFLSEQLQLNFLFKRLIVDFYIYCTRNFTLNKFILNKIPLAMQRKLINQFLKNFKIHQIKFSNIQNTLNKIEQKISHKNSLINYQFYFNLSPCLKKSHSVLIVKPFFSTQIQNFTKKDKNFFFLAPLQVHLWGNKKIKNYGRKVDNFNVLLKNKPVYKKMYQHNFFLKKKTKSFSLTQLSFISLALSKHCLKKTPSFAKNLVFLNQVQNYYFLNKIYKYKKNLKIFIVTKTLLLCFSLNKKNLPIYNASLKISLFSTKKTSQNNKLKNKRNVQKYSQTITHINKIYLFLFAQKKLIKTNKSFLYNKYLTLSLPFSLINREIKQVHTSYFIKFYHFPFPTVFWTKMKKFYLAQKKTGLLKKNIKKNTQNLIFFFNSQQYEIFVKKKKWQLKIIINNYYTNRFFFKKKNDD